MRKDSQSNKDLFQILGCALSIEIGVYQQTLTNQENALIWACIYSDELMKRSASSELQPNNTLLFVRVGYNVKSTCIRSDTFFPPRNTLV